MAQTPSERQAKYRETHKGKLARLNLLISQKAKRGLESLAMRYGVTQRTALERAIGIAVAQLSERHPNE